MQFHLIDKNNYFFKEFFTKDFENRYSRRYEECNIDFSTCRKKKIIVFYSIINSLVDQTTQSIKYFKKKQFNENLFNKLFSTQKPL